MSGPFKMKYTDGKKADSTAFPFQKAPLKQMAKAPAPPPPEQENAKNAIAVKIDQKVEERVDKVVNQDTNEGLV